MARGQACLSSSVRLSIAVPAEGPSACSRKVLSPRVWAGPSSYWYPHTKLRVAFPGVTLACRLAPLWSPQPVCSGDSVCPLQGPCSPEPLAAPPSAGVTVTGREAAKARAQHWAPRLNNLRNRPSRPRLPLGSWAEPGRCFHSYSWPLDTHPARAVNNTAIVWPCHRQTEGTFGPHPNMARVHSELQCPITVGLLESVFLLLFLLFLLLLF